MRGIFKQAINPREIAIDFMSQISDEEYKKIEKIITIKRDANKQIAIVEAGSKKAYEEMKKGDDIDDTFEDIKSEIERAE